jgi:hypothetical protein
VNWFGSAPLVRSGISVWNTIPVVRETWPQFIADAVSRKSALEKQSLCLAHSLKASFVIFPSYPAHSTPSFLGRGSPSNWGTCPGPHGLGSPLWKPDPPRSKLFLSHTTNASALFAHLLNTVDWLHPLPHSPVLSDFLFEYRSQIGLGSDPVATASF